MDYKYMEETEDKVIHVSKKEYVNTIADLHARKRIAKDMLLIQKEALDKYEKEMRKQTKKHHNEIRDIERKHRKEIGTLKKYYEDKIELLLKKLYNKDNKISETETEECSEHIY